MSVIMTAAGEALKARLQAEGKPLVIDTFVFAHMADALSPVAGEGEGYAVIPQ